METIRRIQADGTGTIDLYPDGFDSSANIAPVVVQKSQDGCHILWSNGEKSCAEMTQAFGNALIQAAEIAAALDQEKPELQQEEATGFQICPRKSMFRALHNALNRMEELCNRLSAEWEL